MKIIYLFALACILALSMSANKQTSNPAALMNDVNIQAEGDDDPHFLSDSIKEVLLKFYGASTVEERAKYVMEPERVLPLMREYYKKGFKTLSKFHWVAGDADSWDPKEEGAKEIAPNLIYLDVELVQDKTVTHVVIRTPEGLKLDWEATVQYGETKNFMLTPENMGKTFTFHCKIGANTYTWNDDYDSIFLRQMWNSFNRFSPSNTDYSDEEKGLAIYEKNSDVGKQLRNMFENSVSDSYDYFEANIIVEAEVIQPNGDGNCIFQIKDIVSETRSKYFPVRPEKEEDIF